MEWWNDELKVLRVEKENAYKKWLCNRTTEHRTEYKEFKKRIIQEKNMMWGKKMSKNREPDRRITINRVMEYC